MENKENVNVLTENANRCNQFNRNRNVQNKSFGLKERSITPPQHSLKSKVCGPAPVPVQVQVPEKQLMEQLDELREENKELQNYKELMDQYNDIKPIGLDDSMISLGTNYENQLTKLRQDLIDNEALMNELNDANQHIQSIEAQLECNEANALQMNSSINALTDTINDKDAIIDKLQRDLMALTVSHDKISKLQRDLESKNKKIQSLERRNKELDRKQITLNKEIMKAKSAKSSTQSTLKNKKIELQSKIKECKAMAQEIKSLNDTIFELKIEIQTEKKGEQQQTEQIVTMEADIKEYRVQIEELHEQLTLVQTESEMRHRQCMAAQQAHQEVLDGLNDANEQKEGYKVEIEKLWDELSVAQNVQNKVTRDQVQKVQKQLDSANDTLTNTEEALQTLTEAKEAMEKSMKKQNDDHKHTITTLRLELQTLKDAGNKKRCFFF